MLIVLELANNHCGDVERGKAVIRAFTPLIAEFPRFSFAFKFQYRAQSYLHPTLANSYSKRFRETMLSDSDKQQLRDYAWSAGFAVGCTPFDEESAELVKTHGYNFVKVASVCLTDWPLLETVAKLGLPVIASTGEADADSIQRATTFLLRRVPKLTLLHCVAEYPTKVWDLRLNRLEELKAFGCEVGLSTHEQPTSNLGVQLAAAKGATTYEWHVSLSFQQNTYSLNAEQTRVRLQALQLALDACEAKAGTANLLALRRGVYAAEDITAGEVLNSSNTKLMHPAQEGQLLANCLSKYTEHVTAKTLGASEPILACALQARDLRRLTTKASDTVLEVLRASKVPVPKQFKLVISHHLGLERFAECGCGQVLIVSNTNYCKKLIVMLPKQRHPSHRHSQKEETFVVAYGQARIAVDEELYYAKVGDTTHISCGAWHAMDAGPAGAVLEEISTADVRDSEYAIPVHSQRKTEVHISL